MNDHINPNHEINSELLSAYLDNELTDDERVVVEQALEDSPQSRESLQEFKVLRNEMQWLAVEFHPNEQQMIDTVITKIRDRNLSVHGQASYSNLKIPTMAKSWKQRLQIPALLTLTAGVLAVLTLPFIPSKQSTTLVHTDQHEGTPSVERLYQAEMDASGFKAAETDADDGPVGAMAGGMSDEGAQMVGRPAALDDDRHLQEDMDHRDNANSLAVRKSGNANESATPAQSRARSFPIASAVNDSKNEQRLNKQAPDKTDVAGVTYHIQVKQKDLPDLLALLAAQQNLAQNMQRKKVVGLTEGQKSAAAEPLRRVSPNKPMNNGVQKSTFNQIVMFRSDTSQLEVLVGMLQKNSSFVLSMNHLQRGTPEGQPAEEKNTPNANSKDQKTALTLSDTIFSVQVIGTP
ncbi:MAG: anti-sigma factor family protein [Pirellulales bacterium]|jgi:hypothetical protein